MPMTVDEFRVRFPDRGGLIPAEYAGQWIAWNDDRSEIVANGEDLNDVRQRAVQLGCACPVLQKITLRPRLSARTTPSIWNRTPTCRKSPALPEVDPVGGRLRLLNPPTDSL